MTAVPARIAVADLRRALKPGRARETRAQAGAEDADLATLFRLAADLRPNPRKLTRVARRLSRPPRVLRVTAAKGGGLILLAHNLRRVVTRAEAAELFTEEALLYTRIGLVSGRRSPCFTFLRASFSEVVPIFETVSYA